MSNLRGMFTIILNMSITASYVVIAVIFVRIFLKKPRKYFLCVMVRCCSARLPHIFYYSL